MNGPKDQIQRHIRTYLFYILGNANLIYTIIRKRNVFHQLVNLPTDHSAISKAMMKRGSRRLGVHPPEHTGGTQSMEGSTPAVEAEPGTLKVTLAATPGMYPFFRLESLNKSSIPQQKCIKESILMFDFDIMGLINFLSL